MKKIESYVKSNHDVSFLAEDAVFVNMSSGEETKGRKAIGEMLHYMYHIAFDATAIVRHILENENHAVLEADFKGKHISDFAGMPATGKQVNMPLCVSYDFNKEGLISKARIYMLTDVLISQLKPEMAGAL